MKCESWAGIQDCENYFTRTSIESRCKIERATETAFNVGECGVPGAGWLPGPLCQGHAAGAIPDRPLEW